MAPRSVWTVDDLISETAKRRGGLKKEDGKTSTLEQWMKEYQEAWKVYNRYSRNCLKERRTLNVTNFCKVGWTVKRRGDFSETGRFSYRPYFKISEAFARSFGLGSWGHDDQSGGNAPVVSKDLASEEEFSFLKASMKYSRSLNKDQIFTGVRGLVQQLGEAIASGKNVSLDFEFGRLTSVEKKPKFTFSAWVYKDEGLKIPHDAVMEHLTARTGMTAQTARTEASEPRTTNKVQTTDEGKGEKKPEGVPPASSHPPIPRSDVSGSVSCSSYASSYETEKSKKSKSKNKKTSREAEEKAALMEMNPLVPDPKEANAYRPLGKPGIAPGTKFKQDAAYKESLGRHITDMEIRASEAIRERHQWENHVVRCLEQEKADVDRRKSLNRENSMYLIQQMSWNENKRIETTPQDRKNWIQGASAHEFPTFTEPPEADLKVLMKQHQVRMRSELDQQVRTNNALRELTRQKDRQLENSQLANNRAELQRQLEEDIGKKVAERRALSESWNREIRMKHIWNSIENHVNAPKSHADLSGKMDALGGQKNTPSTARSGMSGAPRKAPMGAARSLAVQKGS